MSEFNGVSKVFGLIHLEFGKLTSDLLLFGQDIYMGSEVINNYGKLSNAQLLQRYGYVEEALIPNDCAEVSIWEILESMKSWQEKPPEGSDMSKRLLFLKKHGLLPRGGWFKIYGNKSPPVDLTESLRVLTISDEKFCRLCQDVEEWRIPRVRPMHSSADIGFMVGLVSSLQLFAEKRVSQLKHGQDLLGDLQILSNNETHAYMASIVVQSELNAWINFYQWLQRNSKKILKHPRIAWRCVRLC